MNRKGFTLVELLAVIVILSGISLIVVSSVTSSLGRREEKECEEQIQLAKNAAKIYFSMNSGTTVTIEQLKKGQYFSEASKTNKLKNKDSIKYTGSGYTFTGTGDCKE